MQNAALEALGLAGEWSYEAIDLEPAEFAGRTRELPGAGLRRRQRHHPAQGGGTSRWPTRPPRRREQIGAANTLSFSEGGIRADNTDASGLLAALPEPVEGTGGAGPGRGRIGAGRGLGAGRAGGLGRRSGTGRRSAPTNWSAISSTSGADAPAEGGSTAVTGEQARANGYELIVNCTAIGMRDEDPFEHLPLEPERLERGITLVDLVYAGSESRLAS